MKKVLEDELMSLAHRILKLRNRAEIHELKEQAAVLHEKLAVLSFAEKHFEGLKPTIKKHDVEKSIEADYSEEHKDFSHPDGTEYNEDQIYEHNTEKIKDIVSQMPYETEQVDKMFSETDENDSKPKPQSPPKSDSAEQDFGVHFDDLPDFEPASEQKPSETSKSSKDDKKDISKEDDSDNDKKTNKTKDDNKTERTIDLFSQNKKSLNDSLNQDLKIGLNDRLSFVNQLFKGDTKAYENFIKTINSLDKADAVKTYLDELITGEYTFWKDKEDSFNRLMHIISKKFD